MATKFTFSKENITKTKMFLDYVKKLEPITAMENKQIFNINGNKLEIFAIGEAGSAGAGHVETVIDIKDVIVDAKINRFFGMELGTFINFLDKIKSDDISISLGKDKITISGQGKSNFSSVVFNNKSEEELKEIKEFIKGRLETDEFKNAITVNIANYKSELSELCNMTKLIDATRLIEVNATTVRSADNLCIFNMKPSTKLVDNACIVIDRDVQNFFKNSDTFKISSDKKFYYFDVDNFGIKLMFVPKASKWEYPTEDDCKEIIPLETKQIKVKVKSADFYNMLDEFEGMFESGSWRYKQIKIRTPKSFTDEIECHYDNMANEVNTTLPIEIVENTDNGEDFEFTLPTLHFKNLRNMLYKNEEDTFELIYSSDSISDPHGIGIRIMNDSYDIIIAKMME